MLNDEFRLSVDELCVDIEKKKIFKELTGLVKEHIKNESIRECLYYKISIDKLK